MQLVREWSDWPIGKEHRGGSSQAGRRIGVSVPHRVFHRRRSSNSTYIRAQNDSTTALSKQSPIDPMEGTSPESIARLVNGHDVNWVPWSK